MNSGRRRYYLPFIALVLAFTYISRAQVPESNLSEKVIAAKVVKNSVVVVTSPYGRLSPGENKICVAVRDAITGNAVAVRSARMEFSLHVGKILQKPIKAKLAEDSTGRSCGYINLGHPYYAPANFHAEIRYADIEKKERKVGFCIAVG